MRKHRPSVLKLWHRNHEYFEGMFAVIIARFTYLEAMVMSRVQSDWMTTWIYVILFVEHHFRTSGWVENLSTLD